jgi:hypothetical protein
MIYSWEPAFGSAVSFLYGFDKPAGGLYVEKKTFSLPFIKRRLEDGNLHSESGDRKKDEKIRSLPE